MPDEIDREIARLKLATMGIEIDQLTEEQAKYLALVGRGHAERTRGSVLAAREPERDHPPGGRRRRPARPAPPARRGGRARCRTRRRGRRGDPDAGRPRRAGDRDRGRLRLRARGRARRGPRGRGRACSPPSRPTAVNLAWALEEMRRADAIRPSARAADPPRGGRALPAHGRARAPSCSSPGSRALTHCNAGGLATGGYGTAVGALRAAWERGLLEHVSSTRRGRCSRARG